MVAGVSVAAGNQGNVTLVVETGQLPRYECDRVHLGYSPLSQVPSEWYHCDDNRVSKVKASDVMQRQAYVLFYERAADS